MSAPTTGASAHRDRLVAAMAELVVERGYASVTVTDVVARARVSKRTFYEHFPEREACFLATYEALAEGPLRSIAAVAEDPEVRRLGVRDQVGRAVGAYLAALAGSPDLTRSLLTQIASIGARGREVRRHVFARFADQLLVYTADAATLDPDCRPLTRDLALALVGGINELVLEALEDESDPDRPSSAGPEADRPRIERLAEPVTDLVLAVLRRPDGERTT